jgi:DNA-binding XRE family transcriptional regulator
MSDKMSNKIINMIFKDVILCEFDIKKGFSSIEVMKLIASPQQIRAARAMLGWSQAELASHSSVARSTVALIERGNDDVNDASRSKIQRALESQGVEFLPSLDGKGEGIRLTPKS